MKPLLSQTIKLRKSQHQLTDPLTPHLESLELLALGLTSLPAELELMQQLRFLSIHSKELSQLPSTIFELPHLERLKIKFGKFNQVIFTPNNTLHTLFLTDGELAYLDESIYHLAKIEILVLSNNQLTSLPKNLTLLTQLRRLVMDNNQLSTFPFYREDFPALNHLSLEGNKFSPSAKEHIFKEFSISL